MILNDKQIRDLCQNQGMIKPYREGLISKVLSIPKISYGLSSFGYDITLSPEDFRIFERVPGQVIDPKRFDPSCLRTQELKHSSKRGDYFIIPAHSKALGVSYEEINMPDDVIAICLGKSTYARCGLIVNITPLEPGWKGHITLEISNSGASDVMVYALEGICQLLFFKGFRPETTYADRRGKYQNQAQQVTVAKV